MASAWLTADEQGDDAGVADALAGMADAAADATSVGDELAAIEAERFMSMASAGHRSSVGAAAARLGR